MAVPISELQSVAPSAVIELFTLELNLAQHGIAETYRFHAGTNVSGGNLVWAGNTYLAMAIEASGFEYSGNGQLPRPKIRVSNTMGTITALILSLPNGLEAAKVTRIRTLARYLDGVNWPGGVNPLGTPQPDCEFPREVFFLDRKSAETREVVEFEMCSAFDLANVRAPKRQCIANICPWVYRSAECSYSRPGYFDINNNPVGSLALDVCNKRLDGCETRFSVFTRAGTVTVGSNVLTLASTVSILPGDPIRGWGLPTGTTVSTVTSSTTLALSANATASSSASKTGTASATAAALVVANTTGLAVGMAVAGTYMNGATIAGISGTTLTLSQRPYSFTRSGTYDAVYGYTYGYDGVFLSNTSGIVAGMQVFGSFGLNTTVRSVSAGKVILNILSGSVKDNAPVTLYFIPASPAASTYAFTADTTYAFRDPAAELPYGGFPGVGASGY